MNKTVNINLAGIFFHIDEDAYLKLQRYLEAVNHSLKNSQGHSEIIADIEARIAEIFNERMQHNKQVIGIKHVDDVIAIMGQPEDYVVDDAIFEDEPEPTFNRKPRPTRKLFRDVDGAYIGGVSSGLSHYFGIDAVWIRLAWVLLVLGAGTGVLLYILLWILVPEAQTTAEKIMMTGEPVNISNIEKQIKDGFDSVSETVGDVAKNVSNSVTNAAKNINVKQTGNSIKSTSRQFFKAIRDVVMFFFKVFTKFIAVLLIFIGAIALIALTIGLFSVSILDVVKIPGLDLVDAANSSNMPLWLISLLTFFALAIPFFFLFYLGLKILVNNLKSIGNIAKITLLGVWIITVIGLVIVGITHANEYAFDAHINLKETVNIKATDTLKIKMINHETRYSNSNSGRLYKNNDDFEIVREGNKKVIYTSNIQLIIRSTKDSLALLHIEKHARGKSYEMAENRAKAINYNYAFVNNALNFNAFLTTGLKHKFRNQKVKIILYVPEGTVLYADENTNTFHRNKSYLNDILDYGMEEHYLKVIHNTVVCLDCPENHSTEKTPKINSKNTPVESDENDENKTSNSIKVKIDLNGIKIETEKTIKKVHKPQLHKDVVNTKSSNSGTRRALLNKMRLQSDIVKVAKNDKDPEIRKLALNKMTFQHDIADIAKNDANPEIRRLATDKL